MASLSRTTLISALLGLQILGGCVPVRGVTAGSAKKPVASRPPATVKTEGTGVAKAIAGLETRRVPASGALTNRMVLSGDVRIISDNGGGLISDRGGGVISNNAGNIISDHGAGLISNNGGGLVGKTKLRVLQQAATETMAPTEWLLADAVVTVQDAAGRVLVDDAGRPLTAITDAKGHYQFEAQLPKENLVLRIRLWQGGTVSAMLARDTGVETSLNLDTASSIGASYVLGRYVRGDQAIYDKLPASEAARLDRDLEAARKLVTAAPRYDEAELATLGETIRAQDPTVSRTLDDIKALLLGQTRLGAGRPALEVPLAAPGAIVHDAQGNLLIGERGLGRIRAIAADGTISTWADTAFGVIKQNFIGMRALAKGADGRVYVLGETGLSVIAIDGTVKTLVTGEDLTGITSKNLGKETASVIIGGMAVLPDHTVVVAISGRPDLLAVASDGTSRILSVGGTGVTTAVTASRDGTIYAARGGAIWRGDLDGVTTSAVSDIKIGVGLGLAVLSDGTLIVLNSEDDNYVMAIAPDGSRRALSGAGSSDAGANLLQDPRSVYVGTDDAVYAVDDATAFVYARTLQGAWKQVAGSHARVQNAARGEVAVNGPGGAVFDAQNRLVFTELGSHSVKRFDGQRIETVAGTVRGFGGDGGPAAAARLHQPRGIAISGDNLFIVDSNNDRLRRVGADQLITTAAGGFDHNKAVDFDPALTYDRGATSLYDAQSVATLPDGQPVWASEHQVIRLGADGRLHVVAGKLRPKDAAPDLAAIFTGIPAGPAHSASLSRLLGLAATPQGDLYISDTAQSRVMKIEGGEGPAPQLTPYAGLPLSDLLALGFAETPAISSGKAVEQPLVMPAGLCLDAAGNLYVGELGSAQFASLSPALGGALPFDLSLLPVAPPRVRKITPEGVMTTIAGPGGRYFSDPNADDALVLPTGLAISPDGRLAILDAGANLIRILPAGSF